MAADIIDDAELNRKLGGARLRILQKHGFFGILLMHMRYALDEGCTTACTDGESIAFDPAFLDKLSALEVDFILLHEIMHVALGHCFRTGAREPERFNIACDIVVNSLLQDEAPQFSDPFTINGSRLIHLAPDGKEGREYSAEQVYELLPPEKRKGSGKERRRGRGSGKGVVFRDDHSAWGKTSASAKARQRGLWQQRLADAALTVEIQQATHLCGALPMLARRTLQVLRHPQNDWRTLLHNFIQRNANDYTFAPPDRRLQDSQFLLPGWNEASDKLEKLWFVVDASGSISDVALTVVYSELIGVIEEFGDDLEADLSFFDTAVTAPRPFTSVDSLLRIRPEGGGGTSFYNIFKYVSEKLTYRIPSCIIILTDGYGDFPPESAALRIPVLWVVNNMKITPPWGMVARVTI